MSLRNAIRIYQVPLVVPTSRAFLTGVCTRTHVILYIRTCIDYGCCFDFTGESIIIPTCSLTVLTTTTHNCDERRVLHSSAISGAWSVLYGWPARLPAVRYYCRKQTKKTHFVRTRMTISKVYLASCVAMCYDVSLKFTLALSACHV